MPGHLHSHNSGQFDTVVEWSVVNIVKSFVYF